MNFDTYTRSVPSLGVFTYRHVTPMGFGTILGTYVRARDENDTQVWLVYPYGGEGFKVGSQHMAELMLREAFRLRRNAEMGA